MATQERARLGIPISSPIRDMLTIEFEITSSPNSEDKQVLTQESRLAKLNQLFGAWKDQP
jgi:hypothetical protein